MNELKIGQFNILSNSLYKRGHEFLKNYDVDIHYSIPIEKDHETSVYKGYQGYNYLHVAAKNLDLDSVNELIKRGVHLLKLVEDEETPLHLAVQEVDWNLWELKGKMKDNAIVKSLLSAQIESRNASNPASTWCATNHLHIACTFDHADAVEFFLKAGASTNDARKFDQLYLPGYSALHFAIQYSSVRAASILLNHGADINLKDAKGVSCLYLLIERLLDVIDFMRIGKSACCLFYDEERVRLESIVIAVLNSRNGDLTDDSGLKILHLVSLLNDSSLVEKFIKPDLDINIAANSNSKFYADWTPLHFAACSNVPNVQLLLRKGANILLKNAKNETPLDFCMRRYTPDVIQTLLSTDKNFKNIFFNDDSTNLLDTLQIMADYEDFKKLLLTLKDVHTSVPLNSPLWPGYTLMHLVVAMNEKTDQGGNIYEKSYPDDKVAVLPKICNCTEEEEQIYLKRIDLCLTRGYSLTIKNAEGLTPIHLAFKLHRATTVEKLLNICKDNVVSSDNLSHFHMACAVGNINFVKRCIEEGVEVNSPVKSSFEWYEDKNYSNRNSKLSLIRVRENSTPLHIAVIFKNAAIVKLLLENGADAYAKDGLDLTSIHLSLAYDDSRAIMKILLESASTDIQDCVTKDGLSHLHVAAYADDGVVIEKLLRNGANVDSFFEISNEDMSIFKSFDRTTPLLLAMRINNNGTSVRALIRGGADIYAKGSAEKSPLLASLEFINEDYMEYFARKLMRDKRVIGAIEENGLTLLHFACGRFDMKWTKKLLELGADPNAQIRYDGEYGTGDWRGNTPLCTLIDCAHWSKTWPKNLMPMVKLLLKYGADVTKVEDRLSTPLHQIYTFVFDSHFYGNENEWPERRATLMSVGDVLLKSQKSYKVNPVDYNRFSHFHYACVRNNVKIVEKFLDNGIDINATTDPFKYKRDGGFTALHFAMKHKAKDVAQLLMERGADVNVKNVNDDTPLHIAVKENFIDLELIDMFLSRGVDINAKNLDGMTAMKYLFMSQTD